MSIASKCDRCGECFDPYSITADFVKIDEYRILDKTWATNALKQFKDRKSNIDLCPECADKFLRFMKKEQDDAVKYVLQEYRDEQDKNRKLEEERAMLVYMAKRVCKRMIDIYAGYQGQPKAEFFKAQVDYCQIFKLLGMLTDTDELENCYSRKPCTGRGNSESVCDSRSAEWKSETE